MLGTSKKRENSRQMQSELYMLRINGKQIVNKTFQMEMRPLSNWPKTICISQAWTGNVFHDLFSCIWLWTFNAHTSENHIALRGFAISKNMHIEVQCDLQFEKSYSPCANAEIEDSKFEHLQKEKYHHIKFTININLDYIQNTHLRKMLIKKSEEII